MPKAPQKSAAKSAAVSKTARIHDQKLSRGEGGELHQTADGETPVLTTAQGGPVSDDQNSLKVGARGPTLLEDFHFREKIFHFDHERIPERVVHARGYGAHGFFETYKSLAQLHPRRPLPARRREDAGLRALLDRRRQQGLVRSRARRARLCGQALHQGRQLGHRRQQHPGVLHPGRHQVSRHHPCGEAGAGPRLPAGAVGARQFLGLHQPDARKHAHDHVGDVGPRHPALLPLHGRLRRPHLPPGQCQGQIDLRQVPLEAEARPAVGGLERGGEDQRRRSGLPSPRSVEGDPDRQFPGMGAAAAAVRPGIRRQVRLRRARPDQDHSRRKCCRRCRSAAWCSTACRTISSPRPSRSRS